MNSVTHTVDGGMETMRRGNTWLPSRSERIVAKRSSTERGAVNFTRIFNLYPNEIVAQEHWCSSGFANTDLDLLLKRHGLQQLIIIGLLANTCIDSTTRFAVELGYRVTLAKDAIASLSWDEMKATLEINAPLYANAIVSTEELISQLTAQLGAAVGRVRGNW
jgi:Isochorismatase family